MIIKFMAITSHLSLYLQYFKILLKILVTLTIVI